MKFRSGEINYLNSDATWHERLTIKASGRLKKRMRDMKPQEAMQLLSGEAENSGLQIRQQSDELHPVSSKGAGSGAGKTYTEAEINFPTCAVELRRQ